MGRCKMTKWAKLWPENPRRGKATYILTEVGPGGQVRIGRSLELEGQDFELKVRSG